MKYPLMEHYYTIQGEGYNTGKAAYFLRLAGCDVGCVWCDVKDSWDAANHPLKDISELFAFVTKSGAQRVVITGGEPAMYNLKPLTKALKDAGLQVYLETSGAYEISGDWDWVCVSPKKFKKALASELKKADELKVIIFNQSDFEWALQHAKLVEAKCKLFVQPEFSVQHKVLPGIIDFVKQYPVWQISIQTHKVMQIP